MAADGARVGVARHKGTPGAGGHVGKALVVEVRDVHHHAATLHLGQRRRACGREPLVRVVPAGQGTGRVPAEGRHEEPLASQPLNEAKVSGKEPSVLYGAHRHEARVLLASRRALEQRADLARAGDGNGTQLGAGGHLVGQVGAHVGLKRHGLLGRELVRHKAGKALCPRRGPDLLHRDCPVVAGELTAAGGVGLVSRAIEVHAGGLPEAAGEGLPAQAVCGVAVQVKDGDGLGCGCRAGCVHVGSSDACDECVLLHLSLACHGRMS